MEFVMVAVIATILSVGISDVRKEEKRRVKFEAYVKCLHSTDKDKSLCDRLILED